MTTRTRWIAVPEAHPVLNATPLIDVLLVLLIMFIITVPVMTHVAKLDMPGAPRRDVIRQAVSIEIEYGGAVVVNGRELDSAALERYFQSLRTLDVQPAIRVETNERAKYEHFAQVIAMAQRNGLRHIAVRGS